MERRWLAFFLVFTGAYFILIAPMFNRRLTPQGGAESPAGTPGAVLATSGQTPGPTPRADSWPEPDRESAAAESVRAPEVSMESAPIVVVETGLATVHLSTLGAVPISWKLQPTERLAAVRDHDSGTTYVVNLVPQVRHTPDREYPLQLSGRTVDQFNRVLYSVERRESEGGAIEVRFTSPAIEDVVVVKTYRFERDSYAVGLEVEVRNGAYRTRLGDAEDGWGLGWQGGFMQPAAARLGFWDEMFAAVSIGDRVRLRKMGVGDDPQRYSREIGWAGQEKKYFAALLVPSPENPPDAVTVAVRRRNLTPEYDLKGVAAPMSVTLHHPAVILGPEESARLNYTLVAAPKSYDLLVGLSQTVPMPAGAMPLSSVVFGKMIWGQDWLRPICLLLLRALKGFESLVHNWGLAIILLVLVVKILLYPLSHWAIKAQARTMAEQMRIKPLLDKITEKYRDDPQKKSQEMMKLYREHGINPLGALRGCFPMLLQMPIFFALYILLAQAVELRGQGFLWIVDLAEPDRLIPFGGFRVPLLGWDAFNILPLLMALTQYYTSKLMTANVSDPMQRQIMVMMPIVFVFILYNMPSGLMLYWTVQNIWQIGHTVLTKRYVALHDTPSGGAPAASAPA
jgi:YidC/Oxa1 family membrane protein insertase